jgi:GH35 family endo-1,4-beta-xylanase
VKRSRLLLFSLFFTTGFAVAQEWKEQANQRIEKIRKSDIMIRVVDSAGNLMPDVKVRLEQTRKDFPFGSAMGSSLLRNEKYRQFFKEHFNYAVFENESKWYSNERERGVEDYSVAGAMYAWCKENGIPVRGHCIFWEPERWQPEWLKEVSQMELLKAVERRLNSAVSRFRGKFTHWDVNNEMLHGEFFKSGINPGIHPWMFKGARKLDPDAKLFVNEFNILTVDQAFEEVQVEEYIEHIGWLQDQGAVIDGVGIQGHIWKDTILSTPEKLTERLDRLASLNLPIWISEFDSAFEEEMKNADTLELVYRTAYAHPAVEGIMMWVFWAGTSWRGPNAGLANRDWTLKESGKRFVSLMEEWSTSASGVTNDRGIFSTRGFFGDYKVLLEPKEGGPAEARFSLVPGATVHMETLRLEQ